MRHPFSLNLDDLHDLDFSFEAAITDEDAAQMGGKTFATKALYEGGCYPLPKPPIVIDPDPIPIDPPICIKPPIICPPPRPKCPPYPIPKPPYEVTTMAIGEEGGWCGTV